MLPALEVAHYHSIEAARAGIELTISSDRLKNKSDDSHIHP